MKTTIDLPDDLVFRAKSAALTRKTTLRNLVMRGLQRELRDPSVDPGSPLSGLLKLDPTPWRDISPDRFVQAARKDWV